MRTKTSSFDLTTTTTSPNLPFCHFTKPAARQTPVSQRSQLPEAALRSERATQRHEEEQRIEPADGHVEHQEDTEPVT